MKGFLRSSGSRKSRSTLGDDSVIEHSRSCRPIFLYDACNDSGHVGFAGPKGDGGTGTGSGGGGGGGTFFGGAGGAGSAGASSGTSATTGSGTAGVGNLLPWLYPTADFKNFDKFGAVALPAIGATATILSFKVDNGRNGKITQMGIDFVANGGAVYNQGIIPAPLTFSIQADGKTTFKDYEQFLFSPGAVSAPTPINGLMLREGQLITVLVTNNTIVVTTQFLAARLLGYNFSKKLAPKIMGMQ